MPAMSYSTCPRGDVIKSGGGNFQIIALDTTGAHGDGCPLTNIHRHGKWKWFISSVRCHCECHTPVQYVIQEIP